MVKRLFIFAFTLLVACKAKPSENVAGTNPYSQLDTISWVIGAWENTHGELYMYESWARLDDSTISGFSFALKGKDTAFSEHLNLEIRNGKLHYIPAVRQQNAGMPVVFTSDGALTANTFAFTNPLHDFPQKITYQLVNSDSILAEISGTSQGAFHSEQFPMKRTTH